MPIHRSYVARARGRFDLGRAVVSVSFLMMLAACVPPKVTVVSSPEFQPSTIHRIAILPFQILSTPQQRVPAFSQQNIVSPEIRSQFQLPTSQSEGGRLAYGERMKIPAIAAQQVTRMVYEALEHRPGLQLVSAQEVENAFIILTAVEEALSWNERVGRVGIQLDVDAVLIGLIRTYRERVGSKLGATPAAVGIEVHLVDVAAKRIYWTGEYYEEQRPMNEDFMGFVERGGAFVTAKELAKYGIQKMMKQFPVGGDGSSNER
ncbi:MAG: hypothetical protein MRJ96_02355 [Nitrospirales bacterium]|nr:hypothetical protein [Nitrospira sp.]MDR4500283.1 hypothetical protein [Nitrospirales bacterium]